MYHVQARTIDYQRTSFTNRQKWKSQPKAVAKRKNEGAPIRQDLVSRVRQEIAAGTYDTPEKFELALDKMLGELDLG